MRRPLILALLISLLMGGVAFGEEMGETDIRAIPELRLKIEIDPPPVRFWFGLREGVVAMVVFNYNECYDSNRCQITITFPDGSSKVIIWDTEDKPLKIEMEPLSDEDYIKELEKKVDALKIHPYDVAPGEVIDVPTIQVKPNGNGKDDKSAQGGVKEDGVKKE